MKKLLILFFLVMVLFYANKTDSNFSLNNYFVGSYSSYSNTMNENGIDLGFCKIEKTKSNTTIGESIVCNNLEVATAIKTLNATVLEKEYLENGSVIIYAYSPLINKSIYVNNKVVNLQIAVNNNQTIIGWPLILGSF